MALSDHKDKGKAFFVGFAEFDEVEGPVISYIVPESFPLDLETNYMIADNALYMNNKAIFELDSLIVYAHPFLIENEALPRKAKKVALIIAFGRNLRKEELLEVMSVIEPQIEPIILEFLSGVPPLSKSRIEGLVKKAFIIVKEAMVPLFSGKSMNEGSKYIDLKDMVTEDVAILDLGFNVMLSTSKRIIDNFMKNPDEFLVIKLSDKKIAIVNKRSCNNSEYLLRNWKSIFSKNSR